jgi:PPOX class probable F420-dependent enzyme
VATIDDVRAMVPADNGLAVVSTLRADGTIQSSVVNAGVLPHPATRRPVVGFVTYGPVKVANLRTRPQVAVTFRAGWQWVTAEGRAELAGPDDPADWLDDAERLRLLLREVFTAAGGRHENWAEYDRVMAEQRRTAVLVEPARVYGPPG